MRRILTEDEIPAEVLVQGRAWQERKASFDVAAHAATLYAIFQQLQQIGEAEWTPTSLRHVLVHYPKDGKGFYSKADLVAE